MPTTTQTLCYNCFARREDSAAPCPYCGFDLAENRQKFPVALPAGTVLNDRYIVGRVLGQGGFGITYLALDTRLQAKVAVKEYMPGEMATRTGTTVSVMMDTKADDFTYGAERFQEEARTLAKFIGHPNIAGVSSYFDENGTSYFVMDYIEGVSFKNYIANNGGKVSVDETLNVMIPVLRALTAVHAEGFIHRDVTPDNIYISKDGNVKLLDFGSARYSIGDKSKSLDVILKVGYAPKEQYIRRGRQGPYTDVYSCAACFYAALTGYLPPESLDRLEEDTLVPVSKSVPDIPAWLDRAILKGLAVQPEDRFQSAAEFLNAIENQLVVEVPAAPAAAPAAAGGRRRQILLGAGAAVLVIALGLGVFAANGGVRPEQSPPEPGQAEAEPAPDQKSVPSPIPAPSPEPAEPPPPLRQADVPSVTILGREYSTDLRELELRDGDDVFVSEADLEALGQMINLTSLTLQGSGIRSLEWAADLTGLEKLYITIYDCPYDEPCLDDLTPLRGMTRMRELDLPNTSRLKSLEGLENMTKLERLYINGSNALYTDLDPLKNLTRVTTFHIPDRANTGTSYDASGIAGMTSLTELTLEPSMESLEPLRNLTGLESLNLSGTWHPASAFRSLEPLSDLTELRELRLDLGGWVTDLSPLASLTGLRELTIYSETGNGRGNQRLKDISPLASLTNLRTLELNEDGVTDISALAGLEHLQKVSIYEMGSRAGYRIQDTSPLDHVPLVKITGR